MGSFCMNAMTCDAIQILLHEALILVKSTAYVSTKIPRGANISNTRSRSDKEICWIIVECRNNGLSVKDAP